MKKKLLVSVSIISIAVAIIIGGTVAYFSDTETSTGNKFTAGKFNLQVGSACHYNGKVCSKAGAVYLWEGTQEACSCTWAVKDLTNELFFDFPDVKPGDTGENTVSIHVDNNDAWMCAELANLKNYENGCESPENKIDAPASCDNPGEGQGELQDNLFFTVWKDNGAGANACNNILDADEAAIVSNQSAQNLLWPIADSTTGAPIQGDTDYCLGIAWNVPIATSNIIQTDSLMGDVIFNAVQARSMDNFKCSDLYTEVCDGKDNDYNNLIDEGNPGGGVNCSTGLQGICSAGTTQCAGGTLQCAQNSMPATEICDGLDNDCDGSVDEGDVCWISPTSNNETGWHNESNGRDRSTDTAAASVFLPLGTWTDTLSYYFSPAVPSNKLKFYSTGNWGSNIEIKAIVDGVSQLVYAGANSYAWMEKPISPAGVVSQIDIRATNALDSVHSTMTNLFEIQALKTP